MKPTTIQIHLLFILLTLPSLLHALSPTLKDLLQDPVHLYHDPSSIPFDSIKPDHLNTIGVDVIKSETGDFNGDGINDLVVGTLKYEGAYNFYLIFGTQEGLPEYSFKQKLDERDGSQIAAKDAGNYGIKDVGFIGDVNGDGLADLLAVVHGSMVNGDRKTYIIYGSNKKLPSIVDPMESTRTLFSDRYLDFKGNQNPLLRFTGIGDFNGDGVDDFVIANEDKMSVVFGSKYLSSKVASYTDLEAEQKDMTITPVTFEGTCFAAKVAKAGDFNGDGFADFMMSTKCDNAQVAGPSKVYLIFGQKTLPKSFPSNYLGGSGYANSLIIDGGAGGDFFGSRIASIGDFNGDGYDDIMISSMYFANTGNVKNNVGGTYIFFGQKDLNGALPHGILEARPELGVFIPGAGHSIAAIGDINKDKYSDILLTKDSSAYVIYGTPNFSQEFSLDKINGKNGWTISSNTRIQDCVGLGDINEDSSPDFALTYGSSKYSIITKDLPKATVCYDAQYCFTPEAVKYLDSNFCNPEFPAPAPPATEKDNEETASNTTTQSTSYSYNPATQGVYNKATEHVVSKDKMSASTAALCGTAIGAGISAIVFLLGGAVKKWYKEGNYVQLEEQTTGGIDWSLESCKLKIYEIEEAINKKFKCYKCLLWSLLVFEIMTILHQFVDMDAFDAYFIARLTLHCFKAFAFGKAIEAYRKAGLEKQKRVVLSMKILYGLGCIFLVLHTMALYQKVKPYWYLPETGLQFAMAVLFLAIFYIGTQLVVCLYAQKFLKLLVKREELRDQLGGNSRVDMQSREEQSAASAV